MRDVGQESQTYMGATDHDLRPARPAVGPGVRCPGFCVFALLALPFSGNVLLQKQLWRERKTGTSIRCAPFASFCAPARRGWRTSGDVGNDYTDRTSVELRTGKAAASKADLELITRNKRSHREAAAVTAKTAPRSGAGRQAAMVGAGNEKKQEFQYANSTNS